MPAIVTEALGNFDATAAGRATGGHERIEIEAVPLRGTNVVQDQFQDIFL